VDRHGLPDDALVLDAWEQSNGRERPWRELALLESTGDLSRDEWERMPVGERDRRLLALRISLFGRWIACEMRCPACEERLELELDGDSLMTIGAPTADADADPSDVRVRPPDSRDVAAAMDALDPAEAILERCVDAGPRPLSEHDRAAAIRRMAELDPGAEIWLEATCPVCGSTGNVQIDPAAIVVEEVDRHARQVLREVDQLARAYGWRESDVLALGRERRHAYRGLAAS
jgi:hypothetical protein